MKTCTNCRHDKERTQFSKNRTNPDGLQSWCKSCVKDAYAANPEQVRRRAREWAATHPDRIRETRREQGRRRYARNPEAAREIVKSQNAELKAQVLAYYGELCACCAATENLSIDHMAGDGAAHRLAVLGRKTASGPRFWRWLIKNGFPEGFQTLCMPCNASKNDGPRCKLIHSGAEVPELITT